MTLAECYRILSLPATATDDEIIRSYKKLALQYHPDRNPDKTEWANRSMATINVAYTTVMGHRFKDASGAKDEAPTRPEPQRRAQRREQRRPAEPTPPEHTREELIERFVALRESAKDVLYRYFQYNLNNIARRDEPKNKGTFNEVVYSLRKNFHSIKRLATLTKDAELLEHFSVFTEMLFNFYRSSECLTILDSYNSRLDIEAYRLYKKGDDALHASHREIFYDRHNRGSFKKDIAVTHLVKAEQYFSQTMKTFPDSSWAVETGIKLEYCQSLKKYLILFFSDAAA
ncbi:MAG TPA: J domain-containing protein [Spirochaetota bacterium]|nr:J domain-containing protein [Spirochaetota bacterium]HPU88889.1 J domain-containing protein [Spirochaetota bacterium]